jgi:hypothetical protein
MTTDSLSSMLVLTSACHSSQNVNEDHEHTVGFGQISSDYIVEAQSAVSNIAILDGNTSECVRASFNAMQLCILEDCRRHGMFSVGDPTSASMEILPFNVLMSK